MPGDRRVDRRTSLEDWEVAVSLRWDEALESMEPGSTEPTVFSEPPPEPRAYRSFAVYCKQCGEYMGLYTLGEARIDVVPCKNCTEQKRDEGYTAGYDDGFAYGEDACEKHTG